MSKIPLFFLPFILFSQTALAEAVISLPLSLDPGSENTVFSADYTCDGGKTMGVQYINAGINHLAVMQVDGTGRLFVNVMSGSGARYVSGEYEWWTKGDSATFSNLMKEKNVVRCQSKNHPSR